MLRQLATTNFVWGCFFIFEWIKTIVGQTNVWAYKWQWILHAHAVVKICICRMARTSTGQPAKGTWWNTAAFRTWAMRSSQFWRGRSRGGNWGLNPNSTEPLCASSRFESLSQGLLPVDSWSMLNCLGSKIKNPLSWSHKCFCTCLILGFCFWPFDDKAPGEREWQYSSNAVCWHVYVYYIYINTRSLKFVATGEQESIPKMSKIDDIHHWHQG